MTFPARCLPFPAIPADHPVTSLRPRWRFPLTESTGSAYNATAEQPKWNTQISMRRRPTGPDMRLRIILLACLACAALAGAALLLRPSIWPKWNESRMQDSDVGPDSPVKSIASGSSSGGQSDGYADHGTGRVACDGKWSDLHRQASQATGSSYADFIRDCMSRKPQ